MALIAQTQLDAVRRYAYSSGTVIPGAAIGSANAGGGSGGGGGNPPSGGGGGGPHIDATARLLAQTAYSLASTALQPGDVAEEVFDGSLVDLRDRDGTIGTTSGNLLFAEKDGEARPVRTSERGVVIDQSTTVDLLRETHELLKRVLERLTHAGS